MNEPSPLDDIFADLANDPEYIAEGIALGIIEDALALMKAQGVTKARLAERMHVSRAYVTRLFNAPPNLTLRTVAQLSVALGAKAVVQLQLEPKPTQASPNRKLAPKHGQVSRATSRARSTDPQPVPGG